VPTEAVVLRPSPWRARARRPIALLRTAAGSPWWRLALFVTLAVAAKAVWIWRAGAMVDYRDAHYNTLFEDAARISLVDYHELPFWNPYYCGGVYALGTPSARFWSPTVLLSIIFGVLRASPLIAVLACVAGLEGTYRYARSHGAGALGALLAAPLFALCGFFPRSGSFEWINFLGFQLLPWAALGLRRAFRGDVRGAVMAGGAVGWMTCFGGTYAAPYTLLVGLWELAEAAVALRSKPRALAKGAAMGAIAALLGAGIAAARLWPIAETLASSPRVLGAIDGNPPLEIVKMLFGARIPFRGDFLVGALVLPLGIIAVLERKSVWLVAEVAFFLWLASGFASHPSGYAMLRTIPPYTMLRSPERFLVPFALLYAVLVARGFGRLEVIVRTRRWTPFIVLVAALLACIDDGVLMDNDWAWQRGRSLMEAPVSAARDKSDFANARGNRWLAAYYPSLNRGTLSCFDDYQVPQSPELRGDLGHEEFLADPRAGTVKRTSWSPNAIKLHADLSQEGRVIINQNWHPGWHASAGTLVDDRGRIAVDLPAGVTDVVVRFVPRSGIGGVVTSLLALVACVLLFRRGVSIKLPAQLALAVVPFAGVVAALSFVHEAPRPPQELTLPNGELIAQDSPPLGAQKLGVKLEEGIELEASRATIRPTIDGPVLDFELDWRLAQRPAPGLGIFVHFEPDKGDSVNIDHVALATVAPFEAFPTNKTLRDVIPDVALDAGKAYKIYVGVWRARRGGERLRIVDAGAATIDANRVLVATIHVP
jgi:hypothetical protein